MKCFIENITLNGGKAHCFSSIRDIADFICFKFTDSRRVITNSSVLQDTLLLNPDTDWKTQTPHELENVDLAIFEAPFGVAENGAVWITEDILYQRVAPFITQHLIFILKGEDIVHYLNDAYQVIESSDYSYGTFIAGPSKTADIEQSLVIGAHGPRSLHVFILNSAK